MIRFNGYKVEAESQAALLAKLCEMILVRDKELGRFINPYEAFANIGLTPNHEQPNGE